MTHHLHAPQNAIVCSTTWSPGFTLVTASPTASTTPAPSWPSTAGGGHGIVPSSTLRSLWHSPAVVTRTLTSVGPGGRTSTSSRTAAFSPSYTSAFISPLSLDASLTVVDAVRDASKTHPGQMTLWISV